MSPPTVTADVAHTAETYDAVPYLALPFPRLHPARMGAVASVLGLHPRPVPRSRVLEIGCATGGHIIPLAAGFPDARIVGIDISPRQIELGKDRCKRLGQANIDLQVRNLTELCDDDGAFDYIICHGVYSWIPQPLREDLMRIIAERLAPTGVAVVSFNVLPGWRILQVVRDSMLHHAGQVPTHEGRLARMHQLFGLMKEHAAEDSTYGQVWRREASVMSALPDFYLAHELFEDHNQPITFGDFMAVASRHGLAYLAETRLALNIPENNRQELGAFVKTFGETDPIRTEQYIDIMTGRTFRESLLFRSDQPREVDPERLEALHFVMPESAKMQDHGDGTCTLVFEESRRKIEDVKLAGALRQMLASRPSTTNLQTLAPPDHWHDTERETLRSLLMKLLRAGSIDVSTEPIVCAKEAGTHPKFWPLAVSDAAAGLDRTATLRHTLHELSQFEQFLVPKMDGTRSREELIDVIHAQAMAAGTTVTDASGQPVTDAERLRELSKVMLDQSIQRLSRAGLLV